MMHLIWCAHFLFCLSLSFEPFPLLVLHSFTFMSFPTYFWTHFSLMAIFICCGQKIILWTVITYISWNFFQLKEHPSSSLAALRSVTCFIIYCFAQLWFALFKYWLHYFKENSASQFKFWDENAILVSLIIYQPDIIL